VKVVPPKLDAGNIPLIVVDELLQVKVEVPPAVVMEVAPPFIDELPPQRTGRRPGCIEIGDSLPAQGCIKDEIFGGKLCKGVPTVGLVKKKKNPNKERPPGEPSRRLPASRLDSPRGAPVQIFCHRFHKCATMMTLIKHTLSPSPVILGGTESE
jgi:hypothetical protein